MAKINWIGELGWNEEQLEDLRLAGFAYVRQGKYDIALPIFEALTVLDKENAYDAQTLGAIYLQMNNPLKALVYLDRALKLETDHGPTLINLSKALIMIGKKNEGLKLAQILQHEPDARIANMAKALMLAFG